MIQLETYRGTKSRHACPACKSKGVFARYRDERGEYVGEDVGRCNRESKCGFHKKPKEFFAENPHLAKSADFEPKARARTNYVNTAPNHSPIKANSATLKPDYIEQSILLRTLGNYENNNFLQFLFNTFPEDAEIVERAAKDYLIGTTGDGKTVFWQIDHRRNVRTGKIIAYDASSGKRRKDLTPNWIHAELKKSGHLKPDFNLRQCFFGEQLISVDKNKPLAIVEAEKTAVIASICFPEFVWLACGAKQNLNADKLHRFAGRRIILYPDADGFALWTEKAREARAQGLNIRVSSLIEFQATDAEKTNGYDLADYLIARQQSINNFNVFADHYNAKLKTILTDKSLMHSFDEILDEQKSVMIIDGGLPEATAESAVLQPDNVRSAAMMV